MGFAAPLLLHDDAPAPLAAAAADLRRRPFAPHAALRGPHRQTIAAATLPGDATPTLVRRVIALDDGALSVFVPDGHAREAPLVVIVHGLGGGVDSRYMPRLAAKALARGYTPALVELYPFGARRRPQIFHAGNHALFLDVISRLLALLGAQRAHVVAVSLGGNIVLRALADVRARGLFASACAISPLVDLMGTWRALERASTSAYRVSFLSSLKERVRADERAFAPHVDLTRVYASTTVREFDASFAAPLGGYQDVWDYYRRASALSSLARIEVPTLVLHAADDPLIPVEGLFRDEVRAAPSLLVAVTKQGGHAGFIAGNKDGDVDRRWAENRALDFIARVEQDARAQKPSQDVYRAVRRDDEQDQSASLR